MGKCPLMLYEQIMIAKAEIDKIRKMSVLGPLLNLAASYILGLILDAMMDLIEQGQDIVEGVIDGLDNMIGAIDTDTWALYAISQNAKTIYDCANREITLIDNMISLIRGMDKENKGKKKYQEISKRAVDMTRIVKEYLTLASVSETATGVYGNIKSARSSAAALVSLLNLDGRYGVDMIELIEALSGPGNKKNEGRLKDATRAIGANITENMANMAGRDAIELLIKTIDTYHSVASILYMYAGINYTAPIRKIRAKADQIASLYVAGAQGYVNDLADISTGDNTPNKIADDMVAELCKEAEKEFKAINRDIKKKIGMYLFSMSPTFNAFDVRGTGLDKEDVVSENTATLSAVMHLAPYSPVPVDSLTVFGASTRLLTSVEMYNVLYPMINTSQENVSSDKLQKIKDNAEKERDAFEDRHAIFEDAVGMQVARAGAIAWKQNIWRIDNRSLRSEAKKENDNAFKKKVETAGKIEAKMSEPSMGVLIVAELFIKATLSPLNIGKTMTKAAIKKLKERREYLDGVRTQVSGITNYSDSSVEAVMGVIDEMGLGELSAAIKAGKIVTGVLGVASAMIGTAALIYDLLKNCVGDLINANAPTEMVTRVYKKANEFSKYSKDVVRDKINKACALALAPIGIGMDMVDYLMEEKQKADENSKSLRELIEMQRYLT